MALENYGRLVFIHGLEGTSQGEKARLLRGLFPAILTPDFTGPLEARMDILRAILGEEKGWRLIGSSFGGLMAAIFACQRPEQVQQLILLAPALLWPEFAASPPAAIDVPVIIYHGTQDVIVPWKPTQELAHQIFRNLDFRVVDDDHGLYKTIHMIDWKGLV
jgi:pimeloyl-ACP methyl ester carboxylesterase